MKPSLHVTKLDVAKRQLETAILLYFNNSDPVSIHTLAAAAYNILRTLNKNVGGDIMLKDCGQFLNAEQQKEFHRWVNEAENFFKHADRDADKSYKFKPESTEAMLVEAARKYIQLTEEYPPYIHIFVIWFITRHQEMFKKVPGAEQMLKSIGGLPIPENRREFFDGCLQIVTKVKSGG